MTEHVHEWGTRHKRHSIYGDVIEVWCPICCTVMPWIEAKRRLNATERLSAEIVNGLLEGDDSPDLLIYERVALRAYADILEGKDA